jgi:hypothetical protein
LIGAYSAIKVLLRMKPSSPSRGLGRHDFKEALAVLSALVENPSKDRQRGTLAQLKMSVSYRSSAWPEAA